MSEISEFPGLNDQEIESTVENLSKLPPGRQPTPIYWQIARLRPLPFVDLAVLSDNDEILLTRREADDPFWPNLWHIPGVTMEENDDDVEAACQRLIKDEYKGLEMTSPLFIRYLVRKTRRGKEVVFFFCAKALGKPAVGEFWRINNLPDDMVDYQVPRVAEAVKAIKKA